ncbi:hypothetical protein ACHAWF_005674, partial [Thalassiosira exigua]
FAFAFVSSLHSLFAFDLLSSPRLASVLGPRSSASASSQRSAMSCLCIGGVCIPYSALLPALVLALRWIALQLARIGLLPAFVAKKLGLNSAGKALEEGEAGEAKGSCGGCCGTENGAGGAGERRVRRGKTKPAGRGDTVETTGTASDDGEGGKEVEHVESLGRWEELFASHENSALFVKFTADWCHPCKAIHPTYVELASEYGRGGNKRTFVTLDVDGEDCDSLMGKLRVAMMPTFVCFEGGKERGRTSGGNSEDRLREWVREMCD